MMTTNEDARLAVAPAAPITTVPETEIPENPENPENQHAARAIEAPLATNKDHEIGSLVTGLVPDIVEPGNGPAHDPSGSPPPEPVVAAAAEFPEDRRPLTPEEFREALGVADLPASLQRLLFAAPFREVDLLDRYVELYDLETWYLRFVPFHDARLVFAKGWLADLLVMEIALRPARSRDELRSRIMMLADSEADRPEHGHYTLVCEAVLRADIARLGLSADDPVVTHFESRMTLKKARKTEG